MEKKYFMLAFMLISSISGFSQLQVDSTGGVRMAYTATAAKKVRVGTGGYLGSSFSKAGLYATQGTLSTGNNAGLMAEVVGNSYSSSVNAFGVVGLAVGANSGCNYGVLGAFHHYSAGSTANGAGVYGTNNPNDIQSITGNYAGYFDGPTYIQGNATATGYLNQSDIRLKENVAPICDVSSGESVLDEVMSMNVLKYNYKKREQETFSLVGMTEEEVNAAKAQMESEADKAYRKIHFGLSAQELQTIYPNLVEEGQDGYLAVNYVELVPVLIKAIQELNEEIDALKGGDAVRKARSTSGMNHEQATNVNRLYQNTPNPFKEQTLIRFTLADDATDAAICIFDMTGKQLRRFPVTPGMDSITINGGDLGAGMYLYSLIVDGQEIDTKRMIISK